MRWFRSHRDRVTKLFRRDLSYQWWDSRHHMRNLDVSKKINQPRTLDNVKLFGNYLNYTTWCASPEYSEYVREVHHFHHKPSEIQAPNLYEWLKLTFITRRKHLLSRLIGKKAPGALVKRLKLELRTFKHVLKQLQIPEKKAQQTQRRLSQTFKFLVNQKRFNILKSNKASFTFNKEPAPFRDLVKFYGGLDVVSRHMVGSLWLSSFNPTPNLFDTYFTQHVTRLLITSKGLYSTWLLNVLVTRLNKRENALDRMAHTADINKVKFQFRSVNFWESLLEILYDRMQLSRAQRNLRKASITIEELIIAVINGFKCQSHYFSMFGQAAPGWKKEITWRGTKFLSRLFYTFFKAAKNKFISANLRILFGNLLKKTNNFTTQFYPNTIHMLRSKAKLLRLFKQMYPQFPYYAKPKYRLFSSAVLVILNICGYCKTTFFDLSHFRVLYRALFRKDMQLLRKFFFLRWRANGCALLRSNMRSYFFLSSFLAPLLISSFEVNESQKLRVPERRFAILTNVFPVWYKK